MAVRAGRRGGAGGGGNPPPPRPAALFDAARTPVRDMVCMHLRVWGVIASGSRDTRNHPEHPPEPSVTSSSASLTGPGVASMHPSV